MVKLHNIYSDVSKQGLGNRLFQYCWSRDIAERKGYAFSCDPIMGFPETYTTVSGKYVYDNILVTPPATQMFNMTSIYNHDGGILVYGYSQRYEYYVHNKENIRKWLYIEDEEIYDKPDADDIVVNIRLGDYVNLGWDLSMEYYLDILKRETYKNAIIICDEPNHPSLKKLTDVGCIIKDNSHIGNRKFLADFVYVKHAKKCIIANSTFSWWSTFLGTGTVYMPTIKFPWVKNPTINDVDLRVWDESRYIIID